MSTSNPRLIEAISFLKAPPAARRQRHRPELRVEIVQEKLEWLKTEAYSELLSLRN
jgi:hypothetical protein